MSNLSAVAASFPVPTERTARSHKGLYLVAAVLYANGLDKEFDKFLNIGRAGKTGSGTGFNYATGKSTVYSNLEKASVEVEGRKFNTVTNETFVTEVLAKYKDDKVIAAMLQEAEILFRQESNLPAATLKTIFAHR